MKLKETLKTRGLPFFIESYTNQQFVVLEDGFLKRLKEYVAFDFWEKYDGDHTVVRFATGWSTTDDNLAALSDALDRAEMKR